MQQRVTSGPHECRDFLRIVCRQYDGW